MLFAFSVFLRCPLDLLLRWRRYWHRIRTVLFRAFVFGRLIVIIIIVIIMIRISAVYGRVSFKSFLCNGFFVIIIVSVCGKVYFKSFFRNNFIIPIIIIAIFISVNGKFFFNDFYFKIICCCLCSR